MSQMAEELSAQFDQLPPHSLEAEMCLLASMMLDKDMIGQVVQIVTATRSSRPTTRSSTTSWSSSTSRTAPSTR